MFFFNFFPKLVALLTSLLLQRGSGEARVGNQNPVPAAWVLRTVKLL